MAQFEVFTNPIVAARKAYPLVAVLQSDLADTGRERIVAPLAPRSKVPGTTGRLAPHVKVADTEYVLFIPRLTAVRVDDLRDRRGHVTAYRDPVVAALDYLFLGL